MLACVVLTISANSACRSPLAFRYWESVIMRTLMPERHIQVKHKYACGALAPDSKSDENTDMRNLREAALVVLESMAAQSA